MKPYSRASALWMVVSWTPALGQAVTRSRNGASDETLDTAFLGLVHLGIALAVLVFGRRRRGDDGRTITVPSLSIKPLLARWTLMAAKMRGQFMLFEQMP